ncbi:MAG: hypothetical protein P8J02_01095 [Yoonia sp.]|nr:hypothetical protein [Yoonia sp.]
MTLQNRVLPTGEIVADAGRGTLTGNRGILHREGRVLGTARWTHKAWICCVLDWQDRKREVMTGRNWTELFFLDEAVAFAAGHRPCGYCRRANYTRFAEAWAKAYGAPSKAPQMDAVCTLRELGAIACKSPTAPISQACRAAPLSGTMACRIW